MKYSLIFFIGIFAFFSCEKSVDSKLLFSGRYHGDFNAVYTIGHTMTDTIDLTIEQDRYQYTSSNSLNSGQGHFIENSDSIEFFDEVARIDMYTWDWILHGKYSYRTHKDTIILEKFTPNAIYRYKLLIK